ncbi:MAG TPA: amidohydrolase family protein [Candidatus Limnocylindrales bacterium]|nr:amidohydrolase family protein [Candidatus Limnocylindrales bacterium]
MRQPIVIHDTTVVTCDDGGSVHHAAALVVQDQRIAAIGPSADILGRYPGAERVDGRGRAVMPGFANTHTHLARTLARGIYEDLSPPHEPPFTGGLAPLPLPPLTTDQERVMVELGVLEAIRSGSTLVLEEGVGIDGYAGALRDSGLRYVMCERAWDRKGAAIGQPGPFERDAALGEAGIARIGELHARWNGAGDGRLRVGLAGWAPDMCSPELLRRLRAIQSTLDVIASIHLSQMWGEVAAVTEQRGVLPTEYLARTGFLSDRLVAAHCRCMTEEEERTLGAARVSVAFNSAIAARRGLSCHAGDLERAGCLVTVGTDNMAEDMVEATRTALFMERVRRQDGRRPSPEEALTWATRNGYRALGVPDGGWLAPGNRADLIVVDLRRPHLVPALQVVSTFVHQGQGSDVESVMVNGDWIMRDRRIVTMDEPAIIAEADRVARAAWRDLFTRRPDLPRPPSLDL